MARPEQIPIQHHMNVEELNQRIKTLEKNTKILQRLYFIKYRYENESVEVASVRVGITKNEGYIWQRRWNKEGYPGIIPQYAGGRPSKLTLNQMNELAIHLKNGSNWTTEEVRSLVKEKFEIEYTPKQIRIILKKIGMHYAKPYTRDYRKPDNADELLKKPT